MPPLTPERAPREGASGNTGSIENEASEDAALSEALQHEASAVEAAAAAARLYEDALVMKQVA